jgi:cell pole-organizing protein PopZ
MSQSAKAQEPSMEEILASIRRIIADDETTKPAQKAAAPQPAPPPRPAAMPPRAPAPPPRPAPPSPSMNQNDIDAMLAGLDAPPGGERPEPESQDILDLTESMAAEQPEFSNFQTIDGQPDVIFADAPAHVEPVPRVQDEPRRTYAQASAPDPSLISSSTAAAVDSAFNTLAQTVLVHNARTLEDLVREMLRPLLKSWLDDNLPGLVERIVKAEIERVARGRG